MRARKTPLAAVCSRRAMRASRDTAAALPTRRPSRSAMICRARQGAEDFIKSMKAGGLGEPGGISCSTIR